MGWVDGGGMGLWLLIDEWLCVVVVVLWAMGMSIDVMNGGGWVGILWGDIYCYASMANDGAMIYGWGAIGWLWGIYDLWGLNFSGCWLRSMWWGLWIPYDDGGWNGGGDVYAMMMHEGGDSLMLCPDGMGGYGGIYGWLMLYGYGYGGGLAYGWMLWNDGG